LRFYYARRANRGHDLGKGSHNYRMIVTTIRQLWHDCEISPTTQVGMTPIKVDSEGAPAWDDRTYSAALPRFPMCHSPWYLNSSVKVYEGRGVSYEGAALRSRPHVVEARSSDLGQ